MFAVQVLVLHLSPFPNTLRFGGVTLVDFFPRLFYNMLVFRRDGSLLAQVSVISSHFLSYQTPSYVFLLPRLLRCSYSSLNNESWLQLESSLNNVNVKMDLIRHFGKTHFLTTSKAISRSAQFSLAAIVFNDVSLRRPGQGASE